MKPAILASWLPMEPRTEENAALVGGKAYGLLHLPRSWVPDFIILTHHFRDLWLEGRGLGAISALAPAERKLFDDFVRTKALSGEQLDLIVRSNCPDESSIESRGRHFSEVVQSATLERVALAIDRIMDHDPTNSMYVLIQTYIQPPWRGHMSNERRISPARSTWLVESSPPLPNLGQSGKIRAGRLDPVGPLSAINPQALVRILRLVAGKLSRTGRGYFHCEWVWDGIRLWIVQADRADGVTKTKSGNKYLNSTESYLTGKPSRFSTLSHFADTESGKWKKLNRPFVFKKLRWPTADVYLLTGEEFETSTNLGHSRLSIELRRLAEHPIVVRCDVAAGVPREDLLLATSKPMSDVGGLLEFMGRTAAYFTKQGLSPKDYAFLLALLVPARASAMVHAHPDGQVARVDALWGYPDGLLFFPHDTYFYYPANGKFETKIRHKSIALLARMGSWLYEEVKPPLDWAQVISPEEIRTLANWGLELAKDCGKDVQLMALARIGGGRGAAHCLPWHFTTLDVPEYEKSLAQLMNLDDIETIQSFDDLDRLSAAVIRPDLRGYVIRPEKELLRDGEFIRASARLAARNQKPILFEGSLLGHAYYLMAREGAVVIPIRPENPEGSTRKYGKLVRDLIPAVIERAGGLARIQLLGRHEAILLLGRKLVEEAYEVWYSTPDNLADELADVLEVVDSLRSEAGIEEDSLRTIKERKRSARGGFEKLIYLKETVAKSLESVVSPKGVPLFLDESPRMNIRSTRETRAHPVQFMRVDDYPVFLEFSIPSIPPVERGRRSSVIKASDQGMSVICKFGPERIVFTIERVEEKVETDVWQQSLFPEDPDGK